MTPLDLWAAAAASVAGSAIAVRAHMLRPKQPAWTEAPAPVWVSLTALAVVIGMRAVSLWFGAHAMAGEAMVDTALAAVSVAMVWNLNRNGRLEQVRRERIARDVETAMQASGAAARFPWERGQ